MEGGRPVMSRLRAPQQLGSGGAGRGLPALLLQPRQHEAVDRVAHPALVAHARRCWTLGRNERPVLVELRLPQAHVVRPRRAFGNPSSDRVDLRRVERAAHRHAGVLAQAGDAAVELAVFRLAGDYGFARDAALEHHRAGVEP